MRLLLAGGGTGGHLFPAVVLAERHLELEPAAEVLFVGTERGLEARVLPQLQLPLQTIDIAGFVGKGVLTKLALIPKLWTSLRQSLRILDRFNPDVVIGVGGYASGPVLLAAKRRGVPFMIHEQNATPGLTNRLLSRWADRICLSFAAAAERFGGLPTEVTGNPVRREFETCPGLKLTERPQLLIFGGSHGARAINQAVLKALPRLQGWQDRLQILHQTGQGELQQVREVYAAAGWNTARVTAFIEDMPSAYANAELVICRAGATTIAELTSAGRPALLVPYPHAAGDHQTANARALADKGAALLLPQDELNGESLAKQIDSLLHDPERLLRMAEAARGEAVVGAADRILAICRDLAVKG